MMKSQYTVLHDKAHAKKVIDYMQSHPNCILKDIIQDCYITRYRLTYLEKQGYLSLPEVVPFGERNGYFRKNY